MSQIEKLLKSLEENPKNVAFTDLDKILKHFGFERRKPKSGSSHVTYSHRLLAEILTIPHCDKHVKPVYVKKSVEAYKTAERSVLGVIEMDYKVEIIKLSEEDGGGYLAIVPKLPGCMSDGSTPQEALENVQDAIKCWIETAREKGRQIPPPDEYKEEEYSGRLVLRIPKSLHKRLAEEAKKEGVSLNSFIQHLISYALGCRESKTHESTIPYIPSSTLKGAIRKFFIKKSVTIPPFYS